MFEAESQGCKLLYIEKSQWFVHSCQMAALHTSRQILIFSQKIIKFCLPIIHNMKLQRSGIIDNKFHT